MLGLYGDNGKRTIEHFIFGVSELGFGVWGLGSSSLGI